MSGANGGVITETAGSGHGKNERPGQIVSLDVRVVCVGLSPLLMHPMSDEMIENGLIRGIREVPKRDMSLHDMAAASIYRQNPKDPNSAPGIPAECLLACLKGAGRYVTLTKATDKISTATSTTLFAFLSLQETFMPLTGSRVWEHNLKRGQMGSTKTAVGIVRPKFDDWGFECNVSIDLTAISGVTEAKVRALFKIAGQRQGLLSFRPQKGGPYGRFAVDEWEVTNKEYA